jgi:hypothetical protein
VIVDETRSLDDLTGAPTIKEWMLGMLPIAKLDRWDGNPPMILTESRSLAGVLRDLARQYGVLIAATNGQCGGFLHNEVIPALERLPYPPIIYLGDLDLCGSDIEANTRRVIERVLERTVIWERLALTQEQVEIYDVPPRIKEDKRFKDDRGLADLQGWDQATSNPVSDGMHRKAARPSGA